MPPVDCRNRRFAFLAGQSTIDNRHLPMNRLWRKDSNLRMVALTMRCLTNLATPQNGTDAQRFAWRRRRESNPYRSVYKTDALYPVELHRRRNLVELRGVEPLRPACRAGIMPLDHSPSESWSRRRDSNPQPLVYETNALSSLSYSAILKFVI
jgi:hypothetical protein